MTTPLLILCLITAPPFTLNCPDPPTIPTATGVTVNVKDFGAVGNGTADDTAAIVRAMAALPAQGGLVRFPAGTYGITGNGIILTKSSVTFIGGGMRTSILKRLNAGPVMQSSAAFPGLRNVTVEDLGFAWDQQFPNTFSPVIVVYGAHVNGVRVSRCRFWRIGTIGIGLPGTKDVIVEDSIFESAGESIGGGISTSGATSNVVIRNNRFRYLRTGVLVGPGEGDGAPSCFTVTGNLFDQGWWLLQASVATGEGASVRYSKTLATPTSVEVPNAADTLTDTAAHFPAFPAVAHSDVTNNIRVMPLRQVGATGTAYSATTVDDPKAKFIKQGARHGDLIRAGGAFAMVESVISERRLIVDEWIGLGDRLPIAPPAQNTAYKLYGILIGAIWKFVPSRPETEPTATKIVSPTGFWDMDGKRVTPPDGTRYEILAEKPIYNFHVNAGLHDFTVDGNTFKRGWGDQVSIYGYLTKDNAVPTHAVITNNTITDGEDTGITLHGTVNYVQGNRIKHQGAAGLYTDSSDSTIETNTIEDCQWVNDTLLGCGDMQLIGASRNQILGNICARKTAIDRCGILVWSRSKDIPASENILKANVCSNHRVSGTGGGDIVFYDQGLLSGNVVEGNSGTLLFFNQTVTVSNAVEGNSVK